MKNSEWYKKLWREKLEELPLSKDTDQAWAGMKLILDQQLPVNPTTGNSAGGGKLAKPFISKVVSLLGFALPAAAIICTIAYFVAKPSHNKIKKEKEHVKGLIEHSTKNGLEKITPADSAYSISSDKKQDFPGKTSATDSNANNTELNNAKNSSQLLASTRGSSTIAPTNKNVYGSAKSHNYNNIPQLLTSTPQLSKTSRANNIASNNNSSHRTYYKTQASANMSNKPGLNMSNSSKKPGPDNKTISNDSNIGLKREALTTIEQNTNDVDPFNDKSSSAQSLAGKEKNSVSRTDNRTTGSSGTDSTVNSQNIYAFKEDLNKHFKKNKRVKDKSVKQDKPIKAKGVSIFNRLFSGGSLLGSNNSNGTQLDYGTGFNYGITAGYNTNNIANNFYFGAYASFDIINDHWYLSPEFLINTGRTVSGSYSHPSYFRPDSIPPFSINDSRKIYVLDIPFNLGYRLSKTISLKGGPVFSIPVKQTAILSKVGYAPVPLDTMQHTKAINAALAQTVLTPKFNLGVSVGIGIQIRRFNIEAKYQQSLTPYKVSSDLGSYKFNSHSFLFGIGFQLNKRR
ncbi:hypothetical protein BDD43_0647 [Mucilaginibacter gracilis]|uniref:Outer membrane protein with beta-barrel domain n=1 Tax=Mucilaginibacter gracilis TaxID=423350 RepID=A0A495IUU7_9SPHI|nr:hypothetical protein [Mucilaginibacter gracilis]RKR80526.1 hypothetical protein BDD43_0647 [Mucilaginibacter gracilis]